MGYYRERIEKLERAINEFLSHSMEFTCDETGYGLEVVCPCCSAKQSNVLSSPLQHSTHCHLSKLAKALEQDG